jgi:hypothetical protein
MAEIHHADDFDRALAHISILCTCTAWISQIVLTAIFSLEGALVSCCAAVLQFLLIAVGLVLSLMCLFDVQTPQSAGTRRAAWIGLGLSSGTILLIVFMFLRLMLTRVES